MIDMNTILKIKGKKLTMEQFKARFAIENNTRAISLATTLVKKGQAIIYSDKSEEENIIAKLEQDQQLANIIDTIETEEFSAQQTRRADKLEDTDLVSIRLAFNTTNEAVIAESWINKIGIMNTEVSIKAGAIYLTVIDISPAEHTKIATKYQMEKVLNGTVSVAGKVISGTTDTVNYMATNVVAPTAKIVGEAGMNLGKGLIHTGVKVGAGLVNSGSKAITDTKIAMATDSEMLKAKKELVDAKDNMISFFRKKVGMSKKKSGIETI